MDILNELYEVKRLYLPEPLKILEECSCGKLVEIEVDMLYYGSIGGCAECECGNEVELDRDNFDVCCELTVIRKGK